MQRRKSTVVHLNSPLKVFLYTELMMEDFELVVAEVGKFEKAAI